VTSAGAGTPAFSAAALASVISPGVALFAAVAAGAAVTAVP